MGSAALSKRALGKRQTLGDARNHHRQMMREITIAR
jgi:hypothetical protein